MSIINSVGVRSAAVIGIVGSVGAAVGNILHPDVPDDPEAAAEAIAHSDRWVPTHLLVAVSIFLMLVGLLAITLWCRSGRARIWSLLAFVAAIAGVVIGIGLMAADGITAKWASVAWVDAAPGVEKVAALQVAAMAEKISFGLVAMFNIFFGGLTFAGYGLTVWLERSLPRWLGPPMIVVGAASLVIGVVQAVQGTSSPTIEILTVITPTLFTLWTVVACVVVLRTSVVPAKPSNGRVGLLPS